MSMQNILNPFGGRDPLVDKLIGPTAYQVVHYVALKMGAIERAAAFARLRKVAVGVVSGPITNLAYPPGVKMAGVVRSDIWLVGTDKKIDAASGAFSVGYTDQGVQIVLKTGFEAWVGEKVEWFIEANEVP